MRRRIGTNIGFLLLRRDVRPQYREGLELALGSLKVEPDPIVYIVVGQLAWD
jgi:hypothetical protein